MSCGVSTYVRTVDGWTQEQRCGAGSGAVAPVPLYRVWLARCRVEVDGEMSPVKPGPAADATVMQLTLHSHRDMEAPNTARQHSPV